MLTRLNASRLSLGRASRFDPRGSLLRAAGPFAFGGVKVRWLLDFVNDPAGAQARMTHDRGGNAMMRDTQGRWVWAPHNLLTWSEDFTKSTWLKSGVTISDDADGFDLLVPASSGSDKFVYRQVSSLLPAVQNTVAIKVKPSGKSIAYITHVGGSPASACYFDLVAGTAHLGNYGSDPFIIPQDDGSYLCGYTRPSNATWYEVGCCDAVGSTSVTVNGSDGVLIKGAHLYRSDFGGMADNPATGNSYVPTTDAPVYLPRIGHHKWNGSEWVNKGLLKEGQATNLCLQSGDVSVSPWVRAGITAVASDGDWYRLQLDTSTTGHYLSQTASVYNGESHCISANVKKGEAKYVQLTTSTGFVNYSFVNFDLENGVVYSTTNMPEHYGIIDNGDDYTIYMSEVTNLTSGRFLLVLLDTLDAGRAQSFSGDGVSGVYVRNLQLEEGTLPSSPIPTNGAAVNRLADGMPQPAGTLPWPTPEVIGPELVTNGTFDTDVSGWASPRSNSVIISVDGKLQAEAGSASAYGAAASLGTLSAGVYAVSFDADIGGGNTASFLRILENSTLDTSSGAVALNLSLGAGQSSASYTEVFTVTSEVEYFIGLIAAPSAPGDLFTIDNISVREIKPLALTIGMAGEVSYSDNEQAGEVIFLDWDAGGGVRLYERIRTNVGSGQFQSVQSSGYTASSETGVDDFSPGINVPFAFCATHASTFVAAAVNGVALTTNTTPTALPDLSAADVELLPTFNGTVEWIAYWAEDIGDAGRLEGSSYGA